MDTTPDTLHAADDGPTLRADATPAFMPAPGFTFPTAAVPEATAAQPATPEPAAQPAAAEPALTAADVTAAVAAAMADQRTELTAAQPTSGAGIPAAPRAQAEPLSLSRVAGMIAAANRGDIAPDALRAALAVSSTSDLAGITPAAYIAELCGIVTMGRPTASAIRNRDLPAAGMSVTYPRWKVLPSVDLHSEGSQPSSTEAQIELKSAPVLTLAGANELTMQSVDRTDPAAVEALLTALAELYGRKVNISAASTILGSIPALQQDVPVGGLDFGSAVAAMMAKLDPTQTPAGGLFVTMAWDYYATKVVGLKDADKPAWWDGNVAMGGPTEAGVTTNSGLQVVVDAALPPGSLILGSRNGATLWESTGAPANVRVVDLGVLSVDVGVYGYHSTTVEYPGGFVSAATGTAPTAAATKAK